MVRGIGGPLGGPNGGGGGGLGLASVPSNAPSR
jgi:hypothetical protein